MGSISEDLKVIEQILGKVSDMLYSIRYEETLKSFMDKGFRKMLFEKNPKCFLFLRTDQLNIPFFPVCNRTALVDPEVISFSMKLADFLTNHPKVDAKHLVKVKRKLRIMFKKYSKPMEKRVMPLMSLTKNHMSGLKRII